MFLDNDKVNADIDKLIAVISGFSLENEADLENFELCRRYALSNVHFHRFLDTSSHDVRRQLEGMVHKLRVHALHTAADQLQLLWTSFVEDTEHRWSGHTQYDIEWRLLSLLLHLSNRPSAVQRRIPASTGERVAPTLATPGGGIEKLGRTDNVSLAGDYYGSLTDSTISDWTCSEDEDDMSGPAVAGSARIVAVSHSTVQQPHTNTRTFTSSSLSEMSAWCDVQQSRAWLQKNVAAASDVTLGVCGSLAHRQSEAACVLESYRMQLGLSPCDGLSARPGGPLLSEWSVCRQLVLRLMTSRGHDCQLFERHALAQWRARSGVRVYGLSQTCVHNMLSRFAGLVTCVSHLRAASSTATNTTNDVTDDVNNDVTNDVTTSKQLCTYTAFLAAVGERLQLFDRLLLKLDAELLAPDSGPSLLQVHQRLGVWVPLLQVLHSVHQASVARYSGADRPAYIRAARLLSVLFAACENSCASSWCLDVYDIFVASVQPLLDVVARWMCCDGGVDITGEFVIVRNTAIDVCSADYWRSGVYSLPVARGGDGSHSWWSDDEAPAPLPFLLPHLADIVETARCRDVLARLNAGDTHGDWRTLSECMRQALLHTPPTLPTDTATMAPSTVDPASMAAPPVSAAPSARRSLHKLETGVGTAVTDTLGVVLAAQNDAHLTAGLTAVLCVDDPMTAPVGSDGLCAGHCDDHTSCGSRAGGVHDDDKQDGHRERSANWLLTTVGGACERLRRPIRERRAQVCCHLVSELFNTHRLLTHINLLRLVFLHGAENALAPFTNLLINTHDALPCGQYGADECVDLPDGTSHAATTTPTTATLDAGPTADVCVSLTLSLQSCVAAAVAPSVDGDCVQSLAACFCVPTARPAVRVQYTPPWPVTLVLSAGVCAGYSDVFVLVLRVKRALWRLQALQFRDLCSIYPASENTTARAHVPACVVHRMQLLRFWLLHFVVVVHSDIMVRALHSSWESLVSQLSQCSSVGALAEAQERHLCWLRRQCLLSHSFHERRVLAAVLRLLQLAEQLCKLWRPAGGQLPRLQLLSQLEADYAHVHRFLALFLQQYRRQLSHLEPLCVALSHSSPCQVVSTETS